MTSSSSSRMSGRAATKHAQCVVSRQSSNSNPTRTDTTPILKLPNEILTRILAFALVGDEPLVMDGGEHIHVQKPVAKSARKKRTFITRRPSVICWRINILRTCKAFYLAALGPLYGLNTVHFLRKSDLTKFIDRTGTDRRKTIERIVLDTTWRLGWVTIYSNSGRIKRIERGAEINKHHLLALSDLRRLRSVRSVTIRVQCIGLKLLEGAEQEQVKRDLEARIHSRLPVRGLVVEYGTSGIITC